MESVSFQLPAGFKKLHNASVALRELLIRHDVKCELIDGCESALQQLLTNIVKYSYKEDESRFINVNLCVEGIKLYIETEDDGIPSNINLGKTSVQDAQIQDTQTEQTTPSDIVLIKKFMDKIEYKYKDGKNLWVLSKAI